MNRCRDAYVQVGGLVDGRIVDSGNDVEIVNFGLIDQPTATARVRRSEAIFAPVLELVMWMNRLRRFGVFALLGGCVFGTTIRCDDDDLSFLPGFDRVVVVDDYYYDDCCDDGFLGLDFFWDDDD